MQRIILLLTILQHVSGPSHDKYTVISRFLSLFLGKQSDPPTFSGKLCVSFRSNCKDNSKKISDLAASTKNTSI